MLVLYERGCASGRHELTHPASIAWLIPQGAINLSRSRADQEVAELREQLAMQAAALEDLEAELSAARAQAADVDHVSARAAVGLPRSICCLRMHDQQPPLAACGSAVACGSLVLGILRWLIGRQAGKPAEIRLLTALQLKGVNSQHVGKLGQQLAAAQQEADEAQERVRLVSTGSWAPAWWLGRQAPKGWVCGVCSMPAFHLASHISCPMLGACLQASARCEELEAELQARDEELGEWASRIAAMESQLKQMEALNQKVSKPGCVQGSLVVCSRAVPVTVHLAGTTQP